jgi:hypothetical protein
VCVCVCARARVYVYRPMHKHTSVTTNLAFDSDIHSFFFLGVQKFLVGKLSSYSAQSLSISLFFYVVEFLQLRFTNKALIKQDTSCYCKTKLIPTAICLETIESCGHAIQHMPLRQWRHLIDSNTSPVIYVLYIVHIAEKGW